MKTACLVALNAQDAEEYAERNGWAKINLTQWKDAHGRVVTYVSESYLLKGRNDEIAYVSADAYRSNDYYSIMRQCDYNGTPASYE
jgi:hypothetical protein